MTETDPRGYVHTVSVVIPVYSCACTLVDIVDRLKAFPDAATTPDGNRFAVTQVILSFDRGPNASPQILRDLEARFDFVETVWLSRNYGQHPATMAGISASTGDWVVTLDEDGQHDPGAIPGLLDTALQAEADVVYAKPLNSAPHSRFRNVTSWGAKAVVSGFLGMPDAPQYQSFRLILGEVARSLARTAGPGAYLDVALGWVANRIATSPVRLQEEEEGESSYNLRRLLGHFWRMVVTGGTQPLRLVSVFGGVTAIVGVSWALVLLIMRLFTADYIMPGWTSLMIVLLISAGVILCSIGVVAEYVGATVNRALGKPSFVVVQDPVKGPLGARERAEHES